MKKDEELVKKKRKFLLFTVLTAGFLIFLSFQSLSFAQQSQQQSSPKQQSKNSQTQPIQPSSGNQVQTKSQPQNPQNQQISSEMEFANRAVEEGKFEEAIKIYSSILEKNPDNLAVRVRLARAYYFATNINSDYFYQAIKEYSSVIKVWPDFSLPYLHLGQIAYLLGLRSEAKGEKEHAKGLYQSAIDWFKKYISLEQRGKESENQREVIRTKILQAVVYWRLGDQDTASRLTAKAVKDYRSVSPKEWGPSPLYDYFVRSSIDYINAKLYNQAFIYLEGAWLIQPRPQIKSLFQSVAKIANIPISLKKPIEIKESKETPVESVSGESVSASELRKKLETISARLENLSSLDKKVQALEKQVTQTLKMKEKVDAVEEKLQNLSSLKDEIEKLKAQQDMIEKLNKQVSLLQKNVASISQLNEKINTLQKQMQIIPEFQKNIEDMKGKVQDISELKTTVQEIKNSLTSISISSPNEKIHKLEQRLNELDKRISDIKSVADRFNILNIQLQELKKATDELNKRLSQLEKEFIKAQKANKG